nr:MAG TPA: replication protein O [Caudoviricetes sp.]
MSNLFDLVSEFSGQKNSVTIPRIYIKLCGGDFTTAAVLSQLVFWSSKGKRSDGYFWKSYEDIANELCEDEITVEQVRYAVKKLKTLLCDCFFVEVRRANGITTNHYRFDQLIFLKKLQNLKQKKSLDTVNGKIPNRENSRSGMGKFPDTVNGKIPVPVTDTNHILTTDPNSTSGKDFPPAQKGKKKFVYTDDDLMAANWIFGLIKNLSPNVKTPDFASWANEIRLMRERDGRSHKDICELFKWANQNEFWASNILSPAKLREKWDQLEIKRKTSPNIKRKESFAEKNSSDWGSAEKMAEVF